jgi:hypothetical protein
LTIDDLAKFPAKPTNDIDLSAAVLAGAAAPAELTTRTTRRIGPTDGTAVQPRSGDERYRPAALGPFPSGLADAGGVTASRP